MTNCALAIPLNITPSDVVASSPNTFIAVGATAFGGVPLEAVIGVATATFGRGALGFGAVGVTVFVGGVGAVGVSVMVFVAGNTRGLANS